MHALLQDIRYGWRQLRNSPGFAVLAVLTLAFGIGANTAMFAVAESVLWHPLPYAHPDRLVYIGPANTEVFGTTSWLNYRDIRDQARTMDLVAGFSTDLGVIETENESVSVMTPRVTPNLFKMLGTQPLLGRTFADADGETGGPQIVLLSEGLWRERFHADLGIIGRVVRINQQPRTVVGVMPGSFHFPESMGQNFATAIWLPLQPTDEMRKERGYDFFEIIGQLKPRATLAQAQAELDLITQRIHSTAPGDTQGLKFRAASYQEVVAGRARPVLIALMAALGLVLLIACANVANLLIARCLVRQQEFAVRAALGAGSWRLIRQMIVEGALLSVLGSGVGIVLASFAVDAVRKLPPDTIPRGDGIAAHWTLVLILGAIATITTVLSALLPALMVSRSDPQRALQAASRGVGARSVRGRISGVLVAGEVALSALLLVATGLLCHTLWNLEHASLGLDASRVTLFQAMPADAAGFAGIALTPQSEHAPSSVAALVYAPTLDEIRHLPGVQDAALVTLAPLSGVNVNSSFLVVGQPKDDKHTYNARITAVSSEYARVLGTPMVRGRMIGDDDTASAPAVAVINEALARKYFAGKNPLGQQLDLGGAESGMLKAYTIEGVIHDVVAGNISQAPGPLLMLPYEQIPATSLYYPVLLKTVITFIVKTRANIPVAPEIRSVFRRTAPGYALDGFQTMQEAVDQNNFSDRLGLYLTSAFAGMAVLMVVAGLYGVLAQLVSYRRREIGIRLALGAQPRQILRMILLQGLRFVGAGLAAGIVVALFTERLVTSFLYKVQPLDAWTYAGVIILLLIVGSLAALLPARRAAALGPMEALREE